MNVLIELDCFPMGCLWVVSSDYLDGVYPFRDPRRSLVDRDFLLISVHKHCTTFLRLELKQVASSA
jgi:hypothetical protein